MRAEDFALITWFTTAYADSLLVVRPARRYKSGTWFWNYPAGAETGSHDPYNYDLIRIPPGTAHRGKLVIKAKWFMSNEKYDFTVAGIRVGFSYLFDISNLKGCKQEKYPLPCLRTLFDRSNALTIGNLVVNTKRK